MNDNNFQILEILEILKTFLRITIKRVLIIHLVMILRSVFFVFLTLKFFYLSNIKETRNTS